MIKETTKKQKDGQEGLSQEVLFQLGTSWLRKEQANPRAGQRTFQTSGNRKSSLQDEEKLVISRKEASVA